MHGILKITFPINLHCFFEGTLNDFTVEIQRRIQQLSEKRSLAFDTGASLADCPGLAYSCNPGINLHASKSLNFWDNEVLLPITADGVASEKQIKYKYNSTAAAHKITAQWVEANANFRIIACSQGKETCHPNIESSASNASSVRAKRPVQRQ